MIRETSILAYHEALKNLGDKQRKVWEIIADNPGICNLEISQKLMWPINCVCPRVKELREMGLVTEHGFSRINGRKVIVWKTVKYFERPKQAELFSKLNVYN